jgi:hypothetical protein
MEQSNNQGSLLELIEDASKSVEKLNEAKENELKKEQRKELPRLMTAAELLNSSIPMIECLAGDVIFPKGMLSIIYGPSGCNKSTLLRYLAIAIVTRLKQFLGLEFHLQHHAVLYVTTEDGHRATKSFLLKLVDKSTPGIENLHLLFYSDNLYNDIIALFEKGIMVDAIIFDAWGDLCKDDRNDGTQVRNWLDPYCVLAIQYDFALIVVHHNGKGKENHMPSKHNLIGSQSLEAKARLAIEMRVDNVNPNLRHLCFTKGNFLPPDYLKESFVVELNPGDFTFKNTGDRTPFEDLVKNSHEDADKERFIAALKMEQSGMTQEQIAVKMKYSNSGGVSKLLTRGKGKGWDKNIPE